MFALRGRAIDPRDIVRFEKRAIKKGLITPDGSLSGQGQSILFLTPLVCLHQKRMSTAQLTVEPDSIEDLGYETPTPAGATW